MNPKDIAKERIEKLFEQAEKAVKKDTSKADRYVELARKISIKTRTKIPSNLKRRFCSHCYSYFTSENYRVRTREKKLIYYCLKCKKYTRIPLRSRN